ncbi:putative [Escherichia phage Mu]|uniref:Bacteriophage Mu left end n=2 Tax=Muvirus mu TaxID=10677 RepID=Q76V00_BPMU|nr:putative [Escherichia phage Mu]CAA68481.1 unnamed protein product [Escherichia phage Mu]
MVIRTTRAITFIALISVDGPKHSSLNFLYMVPLYPNRRARKRNESQNVSNPASAQMTCSGPVFS